MASNRIETNFRILPQASGGLAVAVGLSVLLGWQFDLGLLKSIFPGLVAMNPATAVGLALAGSALLLLQRERIDRKRKATGLALAAAVTAIGLTKLLDLAGVTSFRIDELLFQAKLAAVAVAMPPNRMAPNTALAMCLTGIALLSLRLRVLRSLAPSQLIALVPAGISALAILGYALDVHQLYGMKTFIPMALNTALAFGVLSLGIFFADRSTALTRVFLVQDAGGTMARWLLPSVLLIPGILAWLRGYVDRAGLLELEPGISVMVFACTVVLALLVWVTAVRLSHADGERRRLVAELRQAHSELEERVVERTRDLELANVQLHEEMAERSRAQDALRGSDARYRLLFESNPGPMWVYDRETLQFLAVNHAAVQLYGFTANEFMNMTIKDIRPSEDVPQLLEDMAKGRADLETNREWRHVRKDGTLLAVAISSHTLEFSGRPAVLVLAKDMTSQKQLESQLRQSQKMEAVGRLAGGVAHDFNNLLTAIMGYGQLVRMKLESDVRLREDCDEVLKAAERAASLTRQLLAFSRQQVLEPRVLDLNAVVTGLDKMLRRLIGEDIDLLTAPSDGLGHIKADPGQIEQVLLNLVVNARDAMPEGGKLTIETANVELDAKYASGRVDVKPGRYVMVAVSDTGCGMTPDVVTRIFEPFFTTKELGHGTGLGLSTVHGIVKQSEGHIEVYSELGRGTTFKVYLPRVDEEAEEFRPLTTVRLEGNETVLVVEDENAIRRVIRRSLEQHGYQVLEAGDGSEAIAMFDQERASIRLLITDVVMPLMSGPELAERLVQLKPDLKILFISGYTDRALIHQGRRQAGAAFLQKPFTPEGLVTKVREVIDETPKDRLAA